MFKKFSKKIFLSCLAIIFLFLFFLPLANIRASDSWSEMFDTSRACPCAPQNTPEKQYVRMQLNIPGITEKPCLYDKTVYGNNKIGTQKVNCYYVEANLPDFIRKVYNFSIGIIAIFAVMVTMIGGLRWILSGGNPGQIKAAQDSIKAAISGLVLVLLSYTILNLINPKLTNLELTQPTQIETKERSAEWCKDLKTQIGSEKVRIREVETDTWTTDKDNTQCGKKYEIENSPETCWGEGGCSENEMCYQETSNKAPFCSELAALKDLCEKHDADKGETGNLTKFLESIKLLSNRKSGCDEIDDLFKSGGLSYACAKEFEVSGDDECVAGEELHCVTGYQRVDCEESDKCSVLDNALNQRIAKACSGSTRYPGFCINEPRRGVKNAASICCKKIDNTIGGEDYICENNNTKKTEDPCNLYSTIDSKENCEKAPSDYGLYKKGCAWDDTTKCSSKK